MWNHNIHFHRYLLSQVPQKINRSLDIGCGLGLFTNQLAKRSKKVDAIDVDISTLKEALNQQNSSNIYYHNANFLELNLPENSYDVIVGIASIHHMDLEAALQKIKLLLQPSGKLIILGLYKETNFLDYVYSIVSIPLNIIYLKFYGTSPTLAPTRPAQLSLNQITSVANSLIPGFKVKRHLFWRYSLIWQKP